MSWAKVGEAFKSAGAWIEAHPVPAMLVVTFIAGFVLGLIVGKS